MAKNKAQNGLITINGELTIYTFADMIPDEYLQTFVIESKELLEKMEEALLVVEQSPQKMLRLSTLFFAPHTRLKIQRACLA